MSFRLEMLQVARLAPDLLGEASGLVEAFLRRQVTVDGAFGDREGRSDLYYTVFGMEGLLALRQEPEWDKLSVWLRGFGGGEGLDFVHLCCLARCWNAVPAAVGKLSPEDRTGILDRLERGGWVARDRDLADRRAVTVRALRGRGADGHLVKIQGNNLTITNPANTPPTPFVFSAHPSEACRFIGSNGLDEFTVTPAGVVVGRSANSNTLPTTYHTFIGFPVQTGITTADLGGTWNAMNWKISSTNPAPTYGGEAGNFTVDGTTGVFTSASCRNTPVVPITSTCTTVATTGPTLRKRSDGGFDIVPNDPFQTIDADGVGALMKLAVTGGRKARPNLKIGICGEHAKKAVLRQACKESGAVARAPPQREEL